MAMTFAEVTGYQNRASCFFADYAAPAPSTRHAGNHRVIRAFAIEQK